VVGEHVGRGVGDEAGGQLGPVVVPPVLGDLDPQAGVLLLERVRAMKTRKPTSAGRMNSRVSRVSSRLRGRVVTVPVRAGRVVVLIAIVPPSP
jgi:hypothetical protein